MFFLGNPRFRRHGIFFIFCSAILILGVEYFLAILISGVNFFYFLDYGIDLDIISNEDIKKLRHGEIYKEKCNELAVKMTLHFKFMTD